MTYLYNDPSQLALSNGTVCSVGNSGGAAGNAFSTVTGSPTFESDTWQASTAGGTVAYMQWSTTGTCTAMAVEVEFDGAAAPTGGDARVIGFYNGTTDVVRLEVGDGTGETVRVLKLYDYGGSSGTTSRLLWTSTTQVPTGAGWRVYVGATVSAGSATVAAAIYTDSDGAGTTAADSYSTSTGNTGASTTSFTRSNVGKVNTTPAATFRMRNLQQEDTSSAALGPLTALPPTAAAGTDQVDVEPGATVTLDGTGSSAAGGATITGYAWSQTDGATVTIVDDDTDTPTFTAPPTLTGDTLTFELEVTDSNANTATDTVDVTVLPSTVRVVAGGAQVPGYMRVATFAPMILGTGALGTGDLG